MNRHIKSIKKLIKNPSKIKYLPEYLKQEILFFIWDNKYKANIEDKEAELIVQNPSEIGSLTKKQEKKIWKKSG